MSGILIRLLVSDSTSGVAASRTLSATSCLIVFEMLLDSSHRLLNRALNASPWACAHSPPHVPGKTRRRPSKIWYIQPIIAAILGGIAAYIILLKRNSGMSYKALGLGVGLTVLMVGFSWIVNSFGDSVILAYINENTILGCLKTDC